MWICSFWLVGREGREEKDFGDLRECRSALFGRGDVYSHDTRNHNREPVPSKVYLNTVFSEL